MQILSVCLLASALAACSGASQSLGLRVAPGDRFRFEQRAEVKLEQSTIGQMNLTSLFDATATLLTERVEKDVIEWIYGLDSAHIVAPNPLDPKSMIDKKISGTLKRFVSDPSGTVVRFPQGAIEVTGALSLSAGLEQEFIRLWFPPGFPVGVQPGAVERRQTIDTIRVSASAAALYRSTIMNVLYDGPVDTLGRKLLRVRMVSDSVSFSGKLAMQGMQVRVDGNGTSACTLYYASEDGILVDAHCTIMNNFRIGISENSQMTVPISQRTLMTVRRIQ